MINGQYKGKTVEIADSGNISYDGKVIGIISLMSGNRLAAFLFRPELHDEVVKGCAIKSEDVVAMLLRPKEAEVAQDDAEWNDDQEFWTLKSSMLKKQKLAAQFNDFDVEQLAR